MSSQCQICGKNFVTKYTLERHQKRKHPNENNQELSEPEEDAGDDENTLKKEDTTSETDDISDKSGNSSNNGESADEEAELDDEDVAWRRAIQLTTNRMKHDGYTPREHFKSVEGFLKDPYLTDIVKELMKSVRMISDTKENIEKSDLHTRIFDKLDAIETKYPNIESDAAEKKAWLKNKYDIRQVLLENTDLIEKLMFESDEESSSDISENGDEEGETKSGRQKEELDDIEKGEIVEGEDNIDIDDIEHKYANSHGN